MCKYLLLITLAALTSCGELEETSPVEKKTRPPLEEWLKQRNFTDNFYIDSLGISILYQLVETEDNYKVFTDFQPDSAFVKERVSEITKKTGLKVEDLALYIYYKSGPFASVIPSVTGTPADIFLQSRPILTAKKMILIEGDKEFFTTTYPYGKAYVVRFIISPNRALLNELRKSGVITAENESDYIFDQLAVTSFGLNGLIPKHIYDI
jgi:hypothetical protein